MVRELVLLGTASQLPTRDRNHNGYLLRWDGEELLFDPGEGTQRQFTFAGVSPARVTRICITHFHGDHCLGLPGVVMRLGLDRVTHPVHVHFPASGLPYVERLLDAAIHRADLDLRLEPMRGGETVDVGPFTLTCEPLDHRVDTLGWRIQEPHGRTMLPDRLAARGIHGPDIGRLQREGTLATPTGTVALDEVSVPRPGQAFALVMDTAPCVAAVTLARDTDLLVCESTFLTEDADLAAAYGHLTAADAARIAAAAGARKLVLTHFSQRYRDPGAYGSEARAIFPDVVVGEDLLRIPVPARRA